MIHELQRKKIMIYSLRILILWLVLTSSASAYVDPGSGMLLWQGLIAAIGAVLVFFRNPLASIKSLIKRFWGK